MIVEPQVDQEPQRTLDTPPPAPRASRSERTPIWRQRRGLVAGLAVLLLVSILIVLFSARSATPPPAATPTMAALVAHGQIVPVRQARVGTLAGGQVQQLQASLGAEVSAQSPLAWVIGPSGTEIVTAPFSGAVTNVLVHAGDTLTPGATIAVVADMSTLQVETSDVDEFLVSHVSVSQRVQVTVDAVDNLALSGIVTNVALLPQVGAGGSQAYPVVISLGGVPATVRAGMSVRITLPE